MRILIMGLPGSGKSTQAQRISEKVGVSFISMGNILRELSKQDTPLARQVKEDMAKGELVDDETVAEIMRERLGKPDCANGFILDGYPRTTKQLEYFDPQFEKVLYLNISDEEAKSRLSDRGRGDDSVQVIENRLRVQRKNINAVLDFYRNKGILMEMDGHQTIESIFGQIMAYLSK